ncbi:unnamed protein product, partial [Didymodactylos carnosus]
MAVARYLTSLLLSCEQWELLRRLRNSGLTTSRIVNGLEEIQRMECLFSLTKTCESNESSTDATNQSNSSSPSTTDNNDLTTANSSDNINGHSLKNSHAVGNQNEFVPPITNSDTAIIVPLVQSSFEETQQNQQCPEEKSTGINNMQREQEVSNDAKRIDSSTSLDENNLSPLSLYSDDNCYTGNNNRRSIPRYYDKLQYVTCSNASFTEIDKDELTELQFKGFISVREEVSTFVRKHCLRPAQVAKLAGDYSRFDWFQGSHTMNIKQQKFSFSATKVALCVDDTSKLCDEQVSSMIFESTVEKASQNMPVSSLIEWPKRTRFTFKKDHLQILELAFAENPYPDPRKREELSQICNLSQQNMNNERELVTEQVITHWFQNKRRLMKK